MTGLAPGYRRQRFTVSLSYPVDRYDGPFTTDDVASALIENLDEWGVAVTVTHDTAEDEQR